MRPAIAPSDAPAAVPMMYGSAIGLRRSAWKTVPASDSPPPTSMATSTRGRRTSKMICSSPRARGRVSRRPSIRWPRMASVSPMATPCDPIATATTITTPRASAPPPSTTAVRVRVGPMAIGLTAVAGAGAAAVRIGLGDQVRVDCPGQGFEPVDDPRAGTGYHLVLIHDHDPPGAHCRHVAPSRPRGDAGRGDRHVIGRVAEQDQLRIGCDQVLELDGGRLGVAGDRVAAGCGDERGQERVLACRVDAPFEDAHLVEGAGLGS